MTTPPESEQGSGGETFGIVAVGASAGGLEAFSTVLEHIPAVSDFAFVIVQHLSPQHSSALTELLASHTRLEVVTAANKMRIRPGRAYVMPPNVQMEVVQGELHLLPRPTDRSQFTPIDFFMQSLARWAQDRAVGVILSGTASDGAAGIREIKHQGGITIAQAPESAKHDGMPRAAIATGMVDLVLTPEQIGEHLSQVRKHPYMLQTARESVDGDLAITDNQQRELFAALRRVSSIDFRQYKTPTIRRRLLRRMALLRLTEVDHYLAHLAQTPAEAQALAQDLLIHVTRFFRDPESFQSMTTHLFPELLRERRSGDEAVRIWVPGCATGEEAYSIGICILEALGERAAGRGVQIFATDVSESSIEHARAGVYPVSIAADVSAERLKRFFTRSDGGFRVVKPLRDMCVFARHDLARDPPFSRLDFIACRNVLIYLDVPLQKRLIAIFHYALKTRGFLMLGPAETPGQQSLFEIVDKKWRLFRKGPAGVGTPAQAPAHTHEAVHPAPAAGRPQLHSDVKPIQNEATRLILDRYGPPGAVVDPNFQIIQFRGHTGPYLEAAAGEPDLNILKMVRPGLLYPLRAALRQAKLRGRVVRKARVSVQHNGDWRKLTLEVVPLTTLRGEHFLVLFDESAAGSRARAIKPQRAGKGRSVNRREQTARVSELRSELAASREYLQSIIQELEAANEELQSANEEILSANEELQSTNEELDTAKEELQSTNEELNTVNEELHSRNEELTRVNSDLTNLIASVDIPIVIVGSDLTIRRFTPRAEQLFNLIAGDVGRPIGQIKPNFDSEGLESLIRATINSIAPQDREVRDKSDRWLSLRVRPYKTVDNRLDGAVISVIDVDAVKRYQALLEHARDYFEAITNAVTEPTVVLDARGKVRSANRRFHEIYGLAAGQAEGRELIRLPGGGGGWDPPMVSALIEAVAKRHQRVQRTIELDVPKQGKVKARLTADPLPLDGAEHGILIVIQELGHGDAKA